MELVLMVIAFIVVLSIIGEEPVLGLIVAFCFYHWWSELMALFNITTIL